MNASRRKFLKAGALLVASGSPISWLNAALAPSSDSARGFGRPSPTPDIFRFESFAPYVSSAFQICLGGNQRTFLTLTEAEELRPIAESATGEVFALRFAVPSHMAFPQGIRRFEHPKFGQFDLFLAPVGLPASTVTYEAIINRGGPPMATALAGAD